MRYRIGTLMLVIIICALIVALVVQNRQAGQRELALQLKLEQSENKSIISQLELQELAASHQRQMLHLRTQLKQPTRKVPAESHGVISSPNTPE